MFSKILVPVDFSDESDRVIKYVTGLKTFGLKEITLIHVVDVGRAVVWPLPGKLTGAIEARLEERRAQLEKDGFAAKTVLTEGRPSDEVLTQAATGKHTLIVTGSHGKTLLEEILLGSVSESVSREAKIPVLLVRYDVLKDIEQTMPLAQYALNTFKRVLLTSDFSKASDDAQAVVRKLKKAGLKEVVSLHISNIKQMETEQEKIEKMDSCQLENAKVAKELTRAGFEVRAVCRAGDPLAEILSVADEVDASLIVMGSHKKGVLKEWLVGSVSLNVIRTADRPTLVVHRG